MQRDLGKNYSTEQKPISGDLWSESVSIAATKPHGFKFLPA